MTIIKNTKCDPYDETWEKELMKADKKEIIEMLRQTAKDRDVLNAELRLSEWQNVDKIDSNCVIRNVSNSLPVKLELKWQCMNCGKVNNEQNCECKQ